MIKYRDFFSDIKANLTERETIEWTNFWRDNANSIANSRILLIGDSNFRIIRGTLSKMSQRPVDLIATSSGFHDPLFINQLDCFFASDEYHYDYIFTQFGHHAEYGPSGAYYSDKDYLIFEKDFENLVKYLQQHTSNLIIESTFYTVIPYKRTLFNRLIRPNEPIDMAAKSRKDLKNTLMKKVALKYNLPFCDINQYMQTHGQYYRHTDEIHYEERAKPFIVNKMLEYLPVNQREKSE